MVRQRSRNLTDTDIAQIVAILDGWAGKLTWDSLIEAIGIRMRVRYTRQTLDKHERIAQAFAGKKKMLSLARAVGAPEASSPELQAANERIARLEDENTRLKGENQMLLGQFARWAYNAHTRGLDKVFLSRPMPPVDRDQTVIKSDSGQ